MTLAPKILAIIASGVPGGNAALETIVWYAVKFVE